MATRECTGCSTIVAIDGSRDQVVSSCESCGKPATGPTKRATKRNTYQAVHPEDGRMVETTRGGRLVKWFTFTDFGKGKGFQWLGTSSADSYKGALKAARSTNHYGIRYVAVEARLIG